MSKPVPTTRIEPVEIMQPGTSSCQGCGHGIIARNAMKTFGTLVVFNPTVYKYLLGLASSMQMAGDYEGASLYYFLCPALDDGKPEPFLHLAECLVRLEDREGAVENLEKAMEVAGEDPEHQAVKDRAGTMLENLKGQDA